ncbi:unnamed protein product, partial [Mesorhabditis spiculigera]
MNEDLQRRINQLRTVGATLDEQLANSIENEKLLRERLKELQHDADEVFEALGSNLRGLGGGDMGDAGEGTTESVFCRVFCCKKREAASLVPPTREADAALPRIGTGTSDEESKTIPVRAAPKSMEETSYFQTRVTEFGMLGRSEAAFRLNAEECITESKDALDYFTKLYNSNGERLKKLKKREEEIDERKNKLLQMNYRPSITTERDHHVSRDDTRNPRKELSSHPTCKLLRRTSQRPGSGGKEKGLVGNTKGRPRKTWHGFCQMEEHEATDLNDELGVAACHPCRNKFTKAVQRLERCPPCEGKCPNTSACSRCKLRRLRSSICLNSVFMQEKDEYMRSPCDISEKFIVIELCETIQPHTIELGNYELFSLGPKAIRVSAAEKFPANEWSTVLEIEAQDSRFLQTFRVTKMGLYAKFLKESVFIKLNKRIAALELNMSLSSEYLSELSRQYVAQSEAQEKNIVRAKRIADGAVINATTHINKTLNVQLETMRREVF